MCADRLLSRFDVLLTNEHRLQCNKERGEVARTQERQACHNRRLSKAVWPEDHLAPFHSLLQTHTSLLLLSLSASSTETCFISLPCVPSLFHIKQAETHIIYTQPVNLSYIIVSHLKRSRINVILNYSSFTAYITPSIYPCKFRVVY